MKIYPGFGGWLLFAACTCAVFMAGARLMEVTRKDNRQRRRRSDYFADPPKIGKFRQLAALPEIRLGHPMASKMADFRQKIRFGTAPANLVGMSFTSPQGSRSKTMTNFTLPHSITAAIGAILISTMFVGAAVGPAPPPPATSLRLRSSA